MAAFIDRLLPSSNATSADVDRLFSGAEPSTSNATERVPGALAAGTLDEPITTTILRDLRRIYSNLVMVVVPIELAKYVDHGVDDGLGGDGDGRELAPASPTARQAARRNQALKNWDLWGPMFFTLGLAIPLSIGTSKPSSTFSLVFGLISIGACVLTVNVVLLGGSIGIFQSLCLLGYCLAPLNVAAILFLFVHNPVVRWIVMPLTVLWSSWAAVPFVSGAVAKDKRVLAIYPLVLLYSVIGWLALIK